MNTRLVELTATLGQSLCFTSRGTPSPQPLNEVAPHHDDPPLRDQGRPTPPMDSRRSNTENQRNDLIRHDCGTIASPCRSVTICIYDYRVRKAAERGEERKKISNSSLGGDGSRRDAKNVRHIRLHRHRACIYVFILLLVR